MECFLAHDADLCNAHDNMGAAGRVALVDATRMDPSLGEDHDCLGVERMSGLIKRTNRLL